MTTVRPAVAADVPAMLELAAGKREEYKAYQRIFWRPAADAAAKQEPFFHRLVDDPNTIGLVHETDDEVDGFLFAAILHPPPVYDPGGSVCVVDDFALRSPDAWPTVGAALLEGAREAAKARGAVLTVVITAHLDDPKKAALAAGGWTPGSEWWIRPS